MVAEYTFGQKNIWIHAWYDVVLSYWLPYIAQGWKQELCEFDWKRSGQNLISCSQSITFLAILIARLDIAGLITIDTWQRAPGRMSRLEARSAVNFLWPLARQGSPIPHFGQTRIPNSPFWPDKDHYFSLSEALFGAGLLHCLVGGLWPDKAPQQCIEVIWSWLIFPHGEFYLMLGFCGQRQVDFLLFYMFVLAIQRKASQRI